MDRVGVIICALTIVGSLLLVFALVALLWVVCIGGVILGGVCMVGDWRDRDSPLSPEHLPERVETLRQDLAAVQAETAARASVRDRLLASEGYDGPGFLRAQQAWR